VIVAVAEFPLWEPGQGWRVSEEPLLQIGALQGRDEYIFHDLVGAVRMSDERIVVADRGFAELRFYDSAGAFLGRVGGSGEGPGEFENLSFLGTFAGDSLVTYDRALLRIQVFDPHGRFIRSFRVESRWAGFFRDMVLGVLGSSKLAMEFAGIGTEVPHGVVRWPPELIVSVDLNTRQLDSLYLLPGPEAEVEDRGGGGYSHAAVLFAKENEFAVARDEVAVISTDAFAVHVIGVNGTPRRIFRRLISPERATREHFDTLVDNILDVVFAEESNPNPEDVAGMRRMWESRPWASTLPLLRSVHLDSEGNVWLEPYFHIGASPEPFQVFSVEGIWLGEVAMPPGHDRGVHPRRAPYFQVGRDFVLGVWLDEADVQYVRLYALEKH
jgi:hypothetical protein